MKLKLKASLLVAVVAITAITVVAAPAAQAAAPSTGSVIVPVTGTNSATGATFAGNYTITGFKTVNGALQAVGTLTGTLTSATGSVARHRHQPPRDNPDRHRRRIVSGPRPNPRAAAP